MISIQVMTNQADCPGQDKSKLKFKTRHPLSQDKSLSLEDRFFPRVGKKATFITFCRPPKALPAGIKTY
jgi:hypothetical protein